jgi:hypothetical protein
MGLKNLDGTPYQLRGSVQMFDPNDRTHDLFNLWDQEAILRGGSPLYYYEVVNCFQTTLFNYGATTNLFLHKT